VLLEKLQQNLLLQLGDLLRSIVELFVYLEALRASLFLLFVEAVVLLGARKQGFVIAFFGTPHHHQELQDRGSP
jgi:hypothetical protein